MAFAKIYPGVKPLFPDYTPVYSYDVSGRLKYAYQSYTTL